MFLEKILLGERIIRFALLECHKAIYSRLVPKAFISGLPLAAYFEWHVVQSIFGQYGLSNIVTICDKLSATERQELQCDPGGAIVSRVFIYAVYEEKAATKRNPDSTGLMPVRRLFLAQEPELPVFSSGGGRDRPSPRAGEPEPELGRTFRISLESPLSAAS